MFSMLTLKHPSQQASTSCSPETEVAMEEMTQKRKMTQNKYLNKLAVT
jgi:hypothetical protein